MVLSQLACLEQGKDQWGLWEEWCYREETGRHGLAYAPLEGLRGSMREPTLTEGLHSSHMPFVQIQPMVAQLNDKKNIQSQGEN